jgi:hypothetical protein
LRGVNTRGQAQRIDGWVINDSETWARLRTAGGRLDVRAFDSTGRLLAARQLQQGTPYRCTDGALVLESPYGFAMVGVVQSQHARLVPGAEGSLVMEVVESGAGSVIAVPFAGRFRRWALFAASSASAP